MNIKLFNETSNKLSELNAEFLPIVNHLINFISHWVGNNPGYGYEIICTKRSWFSQKKITTIDEDRKNGLSWYLYGNAISINVFQKVTDQLINNESLDEYTKNSLNFKDGSATKFIADCQEWFINNTLDGNVVKIFGVYPNIKSNINVNVSYLTNLYINDPYVIYWGGLFKAGSNFTHWEWHPGYLPSDVYIARQNFLNTSFDSYDLINNLSVESTNGTIPTYLTEELEIIEEDFLSIWNLKNKINLAQSYSIPDVFTWAKNNPYSLKQAITIFNIKGDYNNATFFTYIKNELSNYSVVNNSLEGSGSISINESEEGYRYITFYNEFGETIEFTFDTLYVLPTDSLPDKNTFDQINLTLPDDSNSVVNGTLSNISEEAIISEIDKTSQVYTDPRFETNEHGMLSDLSINPNKLIDNIEDAKKYANDAMVFEEMITPPIRSLKKSVKGIIDISGVISQKSTPTKSDEMIIPPN